MELAETVLDRTADLAATTGPYHIEAEALRLLRAADHDYTILDHALRIGRTRLRHEPASQPARRTVQLLETVIAYLGAGPRHD